MQQQTDYSGLPNISTVCLVLGGDLTFMTNARTRKHAHILVSVGRSA